MEPDHRGAEGRAEQAILLGSEADWLLLMNVLTVLLFGQSWETEVKRTEAELRQVSPLYAVEDLSPVRGSNSLISQKQVKYMSGESVRNVKNGNSVTFCEKKKKRWFIVFFLNGNSHWQNSVPSRTETKRKSALPRDYREWDK